MVSITHNYIRLLPKAQTFMPRHGLGPPQEAWDLNRPFGPYERIAAFHSKSTLEKFKFLTIMPIIIKRD
jgi:hypothetical protein